MLYTSESMKCVKSCLVIALSGICGIFCGRNEDMDGFSLTSTESAWHQAYCNQGERLAIVKDQQTYESLTKLFHEIALDKKELWVGAKYEIGKDQGNWRWSRNTTSAANLDDLAAGFHESVGSSAFGIMRRQRSPMCASREEASCMRDVEGDDCEDQCQIWRLVKTEEESLKSFICETDYPNSVFDHTTPESTYVETRAKTMSNRYFYVFSRKLTWLAAHYLCITAKPGRGSLATIETDQLLQQLGSNIKSDSQGDSYWIGLHLGEWTWMNDEPLDNFEVIGPNYLTTGCALVKHDDDYGGLVWASDHSCEVKPAVERYGLCMTIEKIDIQKQAQDQGMFARLGNYVGSVFNSEETTSSCKSLAPARAVEEVVYCQVGEDCTLECVTGYGEESRKPVDFRWTLPNGKTNTNRGKLKIYVDHIKHFGVYHCQLFVHVSHTDTDVDCGMAPAIHLKPREDLKLFKLASPGDVFNLNMEHAQTMLEEHPNLKRLSVEANNFVNFGIHLSDMRKYLLDRGFTTDLIEACQKILDPQQNRILVEKFESTEYFVKYTFIILLKNQHGDKFHAAGIDSEVDISKSDEGDEYFPWLHGLISHNSEPYVPPSWHIELYRYAAFNHINDCGIDIDISEIFTNV